MAPPKRKPAPEPEFTETEGIIAALGDQSPPEGPPDLSLTWPKPIYRGGDQPVVGYDDPSLMPTPRRPATDEEVEEMSEQYKAAKAKAARAAAVFKNGQTMLSKAFERCRVQLDDKPGDRQRYRLCMTSATMQGGGEGKFLKVEFVSPDDVRQLLEETMTHRTRLMAEGRHAEALKLELGAIDLMEVVERKAPALISIKAHHLRDHLDRHKGPTSIAYQGGRGAADGVGWPDPETGKMPS